MREAVRISFLGGLGEIGRNCAVVEQAGRLVVLDCGVMFPNPEMPGVDLVLPDFTLLRERAEKIVETAAFAATQKERARWFRGIPKLAYVVFVLVVLLFIGNAKGWIAALAAATKAIAP